MKTEKLFLCEQSCDNHIKKAAEILKNGGIVAIPTETVYGLAASAYNDEAIKKVFAAKGRPQDNPLIVHISNMDMLYEVAKDIPEKALLCAEKFWPGPLTMVLPKTEKPAKSVSAGLETVAVRMPLHKVALDIIESSNLPLAAPSANTSGSPSPTTAKHVESDLDGKIDAIVFSNDCAVGVESTVITFCSNPPRLLRPGAVTAEALKEIVPNLIIDSAVLTEPQKNAKVESPGMKYKHYAPKTDAFLVEGTKEQFAKFVNSQENSAAICFEEDSELIKIPKLIYGNKENPDSLAHEVFATLRDIDKLSTEKVFIHAPSKKGVGLAVYNRLLRASGFKVVTLPLIIGLTGPTGAGKSSLKTVAENLGFSVIDCDKVAREATVKGSGGLCALVKVFGDDILTAENELNRKALAKKAFSTPENTELLNKTILPFICDLINQKIKGLEKVVLDAPTLFESRIDSICSVTIAVLAEKEIRMARIMERDSIDEEAALLRINAGKPDEFYNQNANYVIYNNNHMEELTDSFSKIIKEI